MTGPSVATLAAALEETVCTGVVLRGALAGRVHFSDVDARSVVSGFTALIVKDSGAIPILRHAQAIPIRVGEGTAAQLDVIRTEALKDFDTLGWVRFGTPSSEEGTR